MQKTVVLTDEVKNSDERVIAQMRVVLNGDGSTPNVMTMGTDNPVGYNDDGTPIFQMSIVAYLSQLNSR